MGLSKKAYWQLWFSPATVFSEKPTCSSSFSHSFPMNQYENCIIIRYSQCIQEISCWANYNCKITCIEVLRLKPPTSSHLPQIHSLGADRIVGSLIGTLCLRWTGWQYIAIMTSLSKKLRVDGIAKSCTRCENGGSYRFIQRFIPLSTKGFETILLVADFATAHPQ